jgi:formylglycine-generating enzyme
MTELPSPAARTLQYALAALLAACACAGRVSERPQWRVQIGTDASVPQLGDRLLVEVLDEAGELACGECRRQFGVLAPEAWDFTFGVVPPARAQNLRVRARLYRARRAGADGLPDGTDLIDALGLLPDLAVDDRVGLNLSLSCFGIPAEIAAHRSCDPRTGQLAAEPLLAAAPDTRPPSGDDDACATLDAADSVCIPGGAFLIGDADRFVINDELSMSPERLVQVRSFALDVREFSVGQYRELVRSARVESAALLRDPADSSSDPACTYPGAEDASFDALPLNCIAAAGAAAACAALGKRLPTEAEWEFAARSRGLHVRYPWGDDDDICGHAVIAVGRADLIPDGNNESTACRSFDSSASDVWGPRSSGALPDVTPLGLRELGGNLSEWTSDDFAPYTDECWSSAERTPSGPHCESPATGGTRLRSCRGGAWSQPPLHAEPTRRKNLAADAAIPDVGFRCAVSL